MDSFLPAPFTYPSILEVFLPEMKPPLRLTIRLALALGLLLGGWYIWGGLALALRLFPEADPPLIWVPRYFPETETGWVQVAVYAGLILVLLRSVLGRRRGSGFLAGAGFFVVGIFGTFGGWNFLRDSLAGMHLFTGIVLWRWAKELREADRQKNVLTGKTTRAAP